MFVTHTPNIVKYIFAPCLVAGIASGFYISARYGCYIRVSKEPKVYMCANMIPVMVLLYDIFPFCLFS